MNWASGQHLRTHSAKVAQLLVKSVDNLSVPDVNHVVDIPAQQEVTDKVPEVREAHW